MKNSKKQLAEIEREKTFETDGKFGRICDIVCKNARSRYYKVSEQNEDDCFVKCLINGSISYESAEVKTNGGRIEKCLNELLNGNDMLFIYRMKICNKNTQYIERNVDFRIGWFSDFYKILVACNAIKNTNGRNPELAIQPTSKKLFIALDSYGVPFDNENTYILNGKEITIA